MTLIILSLICSFISGVSITRLLICDNIHSLSNKTDYKKYQSGESEFKVDTYEFKRKKIKK